MSQTRSRSQYSQNLTQSSRQSRINDYASQSGSGPDGTTEELTNNFIRYIILKAGEHSVLNKTSIQTVLKCTGYKYNEIVNRAKTILRSVYGYNLIEISSNQRKNFYIIISNNLVPIEPPKETPEEFNKLLLLLILSHIFMSDNTVTEISLYEFLGKLNIDTNTVHPKFDKIRDSIKIFIDKRYISREVDSLSKAETFQWGIRAEKEISKQKILEFVCKVYKDKALQPENWQNQFQAANEQIVGGNQLNIPNTTRAQNSQMETD